MSPPAAMIAFAFANSPGKIVSPGAFAIERNAPDIAERSADPAFSIANAIINVASYEFGTNGPAAGTSAASARAFQAVKPAEL